MGGGSPGKEDVVGVVKVHPGLVTREGLAAAAEGRDKGVVGQAGHCVADARLCAVPVVHIKVQQSHPLNACHSTRADLYLLSGIQSPCPFIRNMQACLHNAQGSKEILTNDGHLNLCSGSWHRLRQWPGC